MALRVRTATAFRWRPTHVAHATDFVRIRHDGDTQLVAIANAYDSGFSSCYPPGSRLMLDVLDAAWTVSSGPAKERLRDTFDRARQRFIADAPALVPWDPDFPEVPSAVLLAIAIEGAALHAVWIGGDIATLVRGSRAIAETTPDTLYERFRRENPGVAIDVSVWANFVSRTIGPRADDREPPSFASFEVAAGDTLLVMSRAALRSGVTVEEAAAATAGHPSPVAVSEYLADLALSRGSPAYVAVAVLQFEAIE